MVSITKMPIITNNILPNELMEVVFDYADMYSSIVKAGPNGIEVYDFNTLEKKKDIKTFYLFNMSVSPCGTFFAGSNENPNVHIWNLNSGELVQVIKLSEDTECAPKHIITSTNELLITQNNFIYSYNYCNETNKWVQNHTYEVPTTSELIVQIEHNTENLFACGTNTGHIYVFNTHNKKMTHTLTQIITGDLSDIKYINFIKNKLVAVSWNDTKMFIDITTGKHTFMENTIAIGDTLLLTPCLTKVIASVYSKTYVWDFSTGKILKVMDIHMLSNAIFTSGGTKLVYTDMNSGVYVVNNFNEFLKL
jgi:WD40 repeat protein